MGSSRRTRRRFWVLVVTGTQGDRTFAGGQTLAMTEVLETQFAWLGEDRIAYQVLGEAPVDLVICHSVGDCIDVHWDWPPFADFLRSLASFSQG